MRGRRMGTLPHSTLRPRLVSTLPPALSDSRSPGRPPPLPPFPLPPPLSPRSAPRPPPALPPPLPGTAAAAARSSSRRPRSSGLRSSAAASTMASTVSGRAAGFLGRPRGWAEGIDRRRLTRGQVADPFPISEPAHCKGAGASGPNPQEPAFRAAGVGRPGASSAGIAAPFGGRGPLGRGRTPGAHCSFQRDCSGVAQRTRAPAQHLGGASPGVDRSPVRPCLGGGGREEGGTLCRQDPGSPSSSGASWALGRGRTLLADGGGRPEPGAGGAYPSPLLRRLRDHLVPPSASGSGQKSHRPLRSRVWSGGLLRFPSLPRMGSAPPSPAALCIPSSGCTAVEDRDPSLLPGPSQARMLGSEGTRPKAHVDATGPGLDLHTSEAVTPAFSLLDGDTANPCLVPGFFWCQKVSFVKLDHHLKNVLQCHPEPASWPTSCCKQSLPGP